MPIVYKKDIAEKEKEWAYQKSILERENKILDEKRLFRESRKKKIPTSKLLILFLFANCSLIELFVGYVTIKSLTLSLYISSMPDFSPLVTLVGAVVSEVIGYAIYAAKSAKENSAGGITYDMAMKEIDKPVG